MAFANKKNKGSLEKSMMISQDRKYESEATYMLDGKERKRREAEGSLKL